MRRSTQVAAPLLAAAALAMTTGCRKPEMQRCVDNRNTVVEIGKCSSDKTERVPGYRFYYGGNGDFEIGGLVGGGSFSPTPGHHYSTQRGGFGSSFDVVQIILALGVAGLMFAFGSAGG